MITRSTEAEATLYIDTNNIHKGGKRRKEKEKMINLVFVFYDHNRPEKFIQIDPRVRHTLWNLGINSIVGGITVYGTSQTSVMRALSLRPAHRQG